jgi:hypothetical protein
MAGVPLFLQTPIAGSQSTQQSLGLQQSQQQAQSTSLSGSYIPNYSETPILEQIAQYAGNMAPQVYQWGMQQYANNQGNIDALMRNAQSYASPQRIATDVGQAEAGVQQAGEAARQSALQNLQSYGIDPSAGRYAALDNASRVQTAASAAGAGNQQRLADIAQGNAMQQQAISAGLNNTQIGYGAANAMNQLLGTGESLKYSPLGTASFGQSTSSGESTGMNESTGQSSSFQNSQPIMTVAGAGVLGNLASGGGISPQASPSGGQAVDDVPANLTAGEFVIPKDVVEWKGMEHFYKLMDQAREGRAKANGGATAAAPKTGYTNGGGDAGTPTGYARGGKVADPAAGSGQWPTTLSDIYNVVNQKGEVVGQRAHSAGTLNPNLGTLIRDPSSGKLTQLPPGFAGGGPVRAGYAFGGEISGPLVRDPTDNTYRIDPADMINRYSPVVQPGAGYDG